MYLAGIVDVAERTGRFIDPQPHATGTTSADRMVQDHWLHGFNYNVEEWFEDDRYETLAICRNLAIARAEFKEAVAEKPSGRFMIRSRTRVVKRHPEGDW